MRAVGGQAEYGAVISAMPVLDSISGMPISVAGVGVWEKLSEVLMKDLACVIVISMNWLTQGCTLSPSRYAAARHDW